MSLLVPNEGKVALLDKLNAGGGLGAAVLSLYKNSVALSASTVFADFDEADFSGYSSATPSFGSAAISGGKAVITDASPRAFTHDSGGTDNDIYGYFVHESGVCLWAEALSSPFTMENDGDEISVTVKLTLNTE